MEIGQLENIAMGRENRRILRMCLTCTLVVEYQSLLTISPACLDNRKYSHNHIRSTLSSHQLITTLDKNETLSAHTVTLQLDGYAMRARGSATKLKKCVLLPKKECIVEVLH